MIICVCWWVPLAEEPIVCIHSELKKAQSQAKYLAENSDGRKLVAVLTYEYPVSMSQIRQDIGLA